MFLGLENKSGENGSNTGKVLEFHEREKIGNLLASTCYI